MDCFASIIQTDNIKCPLCRGECDESIIEETCLFVDRIEKHYHETVSDTIRRNVTQCINLVRQAISIDLTGRDLQENDTIGLRGYLMELSSKLSWMRVMTSAHANFSNRFFSVAAVNSSTHPIYNMSPEEMFDAMFPRGGFGTTVHPRRLFQENENTPPPLTTVLMEVQQNNERLEGRLHEVQQQINEVEDDINNRTLRTLRVESGEVRNWDPEVEAWEDVMLRGPTGPISDDEVPGFN